MIYRSMRQKKDRLARMCDCGGRSVVVFVKDLDDGTVYRRRVCRQCGRRWSTLELPATSDRDGKKMKGETNDRD